MHSHEAKHVCSAILQHLESAGPNTPPSVCTLKQLKDLFTACRTGKYGLATIYIPITIMLECQQDMERLQVLEGKQEGPVPRRSE